MIVGCARFPSARLRLRLIAAFAVCVVPLGTAWGIINSTVPLGNTAPPTGTGSEPTDPGFSYIGRVVNSTGVYLGNRWVLTADHVGAGDFTLGATTYNFNGIDSYQIGNVDLRLFRLTTGPSLPSLPISAAQPAIGSDVVMIGRGRSPNSATPTTYFVDTADPLNYQWDTSPFTGWNTNLSGFTTSGTRVVRWGTNVLETPLSGFVVRTGDSPTDMLVTDFDASGGTSFESQAVLHDSGSGLFVQNAGQWELAGTIVTVNIYNNQPGGVSSAFFGNETYAIDLSQHRAEINSYISGAVPELAHTAWFMSLAAGLLVLRRRGSVR